MSTSLAHEISTIVRPSVRTARAAIHALAPAAPALAARIAVEAFLTPRRYRAPRAERAALANARFERVPHGDAYLPTWTWGDASAPGVLLVHGWEGRGGQLAAFVPGLLAAGFHVVAFDAPAHGRSRAQRSSVVHVALAVERMTQAKGPFAGLIAHSVGGAATALAFLLSQGALAIERCFLVAPPADATRFLDGFCDLLGLQASMREEVLSRIERRLGVPLASIDIRAATPYLRAPMVVFHDAADRHVPLDDARTVVDAWPGSRLIVTRGLGHHGILRDRDVAEAAAAFLRGQELALPDMPIGSLERDLFDRSRRWTVAAS